MPKPQLIFYILFLSIIFNISGSFASAQTAPASSARPFGNFEVGLPGPGAEKGSSIDRFAGHPEPILEFINLAIKVVIGVLVIIGLISLVVGGYIYMTAAGNASRVGMAKEIIFSALFGIFLSLVSVVFLTTINKYIGSGAQEPTLGSPAPVPEP